MKKTFEVTRTITSTLAIDVEIPDGDVEASLWGANAAVQREGS